MSPLVIYLIVLVILFFMIGLFVDIESNNFEMFGLFAFIWPITLFIAIVAAILMAPVFAGIIIREKITKLSEDHK